MLWRRLHSVDTARHLFLLFTGECSSAPRCIPCCCHCLLHQGGRRSSSPPQPSCRLKWGQLSRVSILPCTEKTLKLRMGEKQVILRNPQGRKELGGNRERAHSPNSEAWENKRFSSALQKAGCIPARKHQPIVFCLAPAVLAGCQDVASETASCVLVVPPSLKQACSSPPASSDWLSSQLVLHLSNKLCF